MTDPIEKVRLDVALEMLEEMDEGELRVLNKAVVKAIKDAMTRTDMMAGMKFRVGDKVEFTDRRGTVFTGEIERMNKKTATVSKGGFAMTRWRVPYTMLKKSEEEVKADKARS